MKTAKGRPAVKLASKKIARFSREPARALVGKQARVSVMKKVAAAVVRKNFSETIDMVRMTRERLIIDRNGKSVAAIVPVEDAELLEEMETADDIRVAEKRLRAIRERRASTIAAADLYKKLGL